MSAKKKTSKQNNTSPEQLDETLQAQAGSEGEVAEQPVDEAVTNPTENSDSEPVEEPITEDMADAIAAVLAEFNTVIASAATEEDAAKTVAEVVAEVAPEAVAEPVAEAVAEAVAETVAETIAEAAAEPIEETATEIVEEIAEEIPEEPEIYVGPNDGMVFDEHPNVFKNKREGSVPITEIHHYMGRRTPHELNNSDVFLHRLACNFGKAPRNDRFCIMDRYLVEEYGYLSRIPLKLIWRIAHSPEAKEILEERAKRQRKGKHKGYGLLYTGYALDHGYTEAQWNSDLERVTRYVQENKAEDPTATVCLENVWFLSEFDFQTAFLHRASQAVKLFQLAMLADARQNQRLEESWHHIRKYLYRVPLEKSKGGIFSDEDAILLRAGGVRYLNDIRKYTVYEIKNLLIEHDMDHVVKEINEAFKEDLARRRDRRLRVRPFVHGFSCLAVTTVIAYMYKYTLLKEQMMTAFVIGLLALWALTIPLIIFAGIRAVYRRRTKRKDYHYFIKPVRRTCVLYGIAAAFVLLSCTLFYERYDGYNSQYFYRDLDDGTIAIAGRFDEKLTACEIPASIDGKTVSEIDLFAFYGDSIQSVTLPETVKTVDRGAFLNCDVLKTAELNEGLTKIDRHAFRGCARLYELVLPSTLDTLGNDVFRDSALRAADLSVTRIASLPDGVFRNCKTLKTVTGLEQVTEIGAHAFRDCLALQNVTLSEQLTSIGDSAFYACNAFTEITVPNSVTYIGKNSLDYCQNLRTVNVPYLATSPDLVDSGSINDFMHFESKKNMITLTVTGNTAIGSKAFRGFDWAAEIVFADSVTEIQDGAMKGLGKLKKVTLPSHLESLNDRTFQDCGILAELVHTDSIKTIGKNVFKNCGKLTTPAFPAVQEIGDGAFRDCNNITAVSGMENAERIGHNAFRGCAKLADVAFTDSLTTIGRNAFRGCTAFVNVRIPNSVTSMGFGAFKELPKLKNITVPFTGTSAEKSTNMPLSVLVDCTDPTTRISVEITGMKTMGWGSLRGCSSVSSLTVSDTCTSFGNNAFRGLEIRTVTLPDGFKTLSNNVFKNCTQLTSVVGGELTEIGDSAFEGCVSLKEMAGLATATTIGAKAFKDCRNLPDVTFNDSLKTIGKQAFRNCVAFRTVVVPDGVTEIGRGAFIDNNKITSITVPFTGTSLDTSDKESLNDIFTCDSSVKDLSVTITVMTETGMGSFKDCTGITSVTIASPVTEIGERAFEGLWFTEIHLPATVTHIGAYAFADCGKLTVLEGTDSLTRLDEGAFKGCTKLQNLSLSRVETIGNNCFEDCSSLKLVDDSLANVTMIGSYAFKNCAKITSVELNPAIETIWDYAFAESGLQSMVLPDSVVTIGVGAFKDSKSLITVDVPEGLTTVLAEAFDGCKKLERLVFEETKLASVGAYAFANCPALTTLSLPDTVTVIPEGMAQNNTRMTLTTLDQMPLTKIEGYAFANCSFSGLSISLPDSLTEIGESAFYGCSMIELFVPASVTAMGKNAFGNCTKLKDVTMPFVGSSAENVRRGYSYLFDKTALQALTVTDMTVVESSTFKGGESSLANVTLNSGITTIGRQAFRSFTELETITLPDTLTTLGASAFEGCSKLSSITIPASLTKIPYRAFSACNALTTVEFVEGDLHTIGLEAFKNCRSLQAISFPAGVVTVEFGAFTNCTDMHTVTFSDTMTDVSKQAFMGCAPETVHIPDNLAGLYDGMFGFVTEGE